MLKKLQEKYPHPEGIFTRRLKTVQIVDKSNECYFVNLNISDLNQKKENKICNVIFNQLYSLLGDSTFMSPEE
ncbi:2402_t:CDS:1, partial [Dentiscutata erythropus]